MLVSQRVYFLTNAYKIVCQLPGVVTLSSSGPESVLTVVWVVSFLVYCVNNRLVGEVQVGAEVKEVKVL